MIVCFVFRFLVLVIKPMSTSTPWASTQTRDLLTWEGKESLTSGSEMMILSEWIKPSNWINRCLYTYISYSYLNTFCHSLFMFAFTNPILNHLKLGRRFHLLEGTVLAGSVWVLWSGSHRRRRQVLFFVHLTQLNNFVLYILHCIDG